MFFPPPVDRRWPSRTRLTGRTSRHGKRQPLVDELGVHSIAPERERCTGRSCGVAP